MYVELVCKKCGKVSRIGDDANDIPAKCSECGGRLVLSHAAGTGPEAILREIEASLRDTWEETPGATRTWKRPDKKSV